MQIDRDTLEDVIYEVLGRYVPGQEEADEALDEIMERLEEAEDDS